jgi:hypothetical protein
VADVIADALQFLVDHLVGLAVLVTFADLHDLFGVTTRWQQQARWGKLTHQAVDQLRVEKLEAALGDFLLSRTNQHGNVVSQGSGVPKGHHIEAITAAQEMALTF